MDDGPEDMDAHPNIQKYMDDGPRDMDAHPSIRLALQAYLESPNFRFGPEHCSHAHEHESNVYHSRYCVDGIVHKELCARTRIRPRMKENIAWWPDPASPHGSVCLEQ